MTQSLLRRVNEARLAVMFLTRLPVGQLPGEAPSIAEARWAFPVVGLAVGAIGWAVYASATAFGLAPLPSAFLALGAMALGTGGIHHDGLADFADGIGGGRDREHCLEIMRDSRVGSYGLLALIFATGLAASGLAGIAATDSLVAFLAVGVASRLFMLATLDFLPPARPDGLGHLAAEGDYRAWIPGLVILAVLGLLAGGKYFVLLLPMALVALVFAAIARRRIGGQTGDVLGAVQLGSEVAGWVTASVVLAG